MILCHIQIKEHGVNPFSSSLSRIMPQGRQLFLHACGPKYSDQINP